MTPLDEDLLIAPRPTPTRPLLGVTVLAVEDSRYACDALRLLCLKSGARIRRADSLANARRHLRVYRPTVVIADLGLPDGSGADLISELARATPRVDVLLGTSGDLTMDRVSRLAGADGFLEKPLQSLAAFQNEILRHLPRSARPSRPRPVPTEVVHPDPIALRDDLEHAVELLRDDVPSDSHIAYISAFLASLARSADDPELGSQARVFKTDPRRGKTMLDQLLRRRLDHHAVI